MGQKMKKRHCRLQIKIGYSIVLSWDFKIFAICYANPAPLYKLLIQINFLSYRLKQKYSPLKDYFSPFIVNADSMLITYDNYPILLFLSYTIDNAPELPFITESGEALNEIQNSTILTNLFSHITINNAANEKKHKNYLLDDSLLQKMEVKRFSIS
jgi:hypothetical protein